MSFVPGDTNPYSPTAQNLDPSAPTSHAVLMALGAQVSLNLRVAVPARVVEVLSNQRVSLQPLFKARYVSGVVKDLPIIPEAHVSLPTGQTYGLKMPIAPGDFGVALIADRSLDVWAASDGKAPLDPQDGRSHNLTDAFFLPGAMPVPAEPAQDFTSDVVVRCGTAQIRLNPAGSFQITNGQQELVSLVQALAGQIQSLAGAVSSLSLIGGAPSPAWVAEIQSQAAEAAQLSAQIKPLVAAD